MSILKTPKTIKGSFFPFYPQNEEGERNIHYIFGRSGSGKSFLAKQLSKWYTKMKVKVFIVSPIKDSAYSGTFVKLEDLVTIDRDTDLEEQKNKYERAKIKLRYAKKQKLDPELLMAMEMALLELKPPSKGKHKVLHKTTEKYHKMIQKPTLFIYDDTEAVSDQGALDYLRTAQLLTGRHHHINMIVINHQANSGMKTRHIVNESNMFTFFKPWNRYTAYFCKMYLQLEPRMVQKVKSMLSDSRRVTVYKNEQVVLSENEMISF